MESGAPNETIGYLDQAQKKDPLNEQIYALLMQAYMQMGFPSNAIQVYKKAKEILKEAKPLEENAYKKELVETILARAVLSLV